MGAQDTEQPGAREGAGGKDQGEREGLPLPGMRPLPSISETNLCNRLEKSKVGRSSFIE